MPTEQDITSTVDSELDICVAGNQGVVITTLLHRYTIEITFEVLPSEKCVRVKTVINSSDNIKVKANKKKLISILDTSASLRSYLENYGFLVQNAQIALFTYSIDSLDPFESLEYKFNSIQAIRTEPLVCAVAALKSDLF